MMLHSLLNVVKYMTLHDEGGSIMRCHIVLDQQPGLQYQLHLSGLGLLLLANVAPLVVS